MAIDKDKILNQLQEMAINSEVNSNEILSFFFFFVHLQNNITIKQY